MRIVPALLLLLLPAASPPQTWYDVEHDFEPIPPMASERFSALETADLDAAIRLVTEATGGRVNEVEVLAEPEPHCVFDVFTPQDRRSLHTDLAGTKILHEEVVPRFAGWPAPDDLDEWVTLESGVRYYDVEVGKGKEPRNSAALVTVHYEGFLNDGTKFQSTYDQGHPMKSPLKGGIPGWREALLTMRRGGKRKILIPPDRAYGPGGQAPFVPPNATLLFDVHLLKSSFR